MAIRDLIYFCCILIEISSHDLPSNKELNYAQERQTRIKEFLKLSPTYTVVGSNNHFDYDNINDITLDPDAHKNMVSDYLVSSLNYVFTFLICMFFNFE